MGIRGGGKYTKDENVRDEAVKGCVSERRNEVKSGSAI